MSTLYAFINLEQFKRWSATADQPCVEQFLREVGTTQIQFRREGLTQPFVPIKPGGCIRYRAAYPENVFNAEVQIVSKPKETILMRMKRYFSFE